MKSEKAALFPVYHPCEMCGFKARDARQHRRYVAQGAETTGVRHGDAVLTGGPRGKLKMKR